MSGPYVTGIDAKGREFKLPVTARAVEFFKLVNPGELPERCPHCQFQSIQQGGTFQFVTIVVRKRGKQETMVDGCQCAKCGQRLDVAHCDIKLGECNE